MPALLQNGLFKLALVFVTSWLGLFTVFITFSAFLRSPEFDHPVSIIPDGVVEQRVVPVAALQSYPLSPSNQQILSSMVSPYLSLTFDTTSRHGPKINGATPGRPSTLVSISVGSKQTSPWSTFGARVADAILLNDMVQNDDFYGWSLPKLILHVRSTERTPDRETFQLSLKGPYKPGDQFASLVRTNDTWSVHLAPNLHASAPSRALPFQRTIAVFLWPALFQNFLHAGGLAGIFLLWVCVLITGYASLTILITHWMIHKAKGEVRGQGAALRWEEEGWVYMAVHFQDPGVRRVEDAQQSKMEV